MDKISSVKRTYSQVFNNDGSNQQNRQVISNSGIKKSKLGTGSSMCGQSEKATVSASGFTQKQEAYNSAIDDSVKQHLDIQSQEITVELTQNQVAISALQELPDDIINTVCFFLTLKDRLSLTRTSKQFSPLKTGTIQAQSLGTDALKQLAEKEAAPWINEQLQSVNKDHNRLIRKICKGEIIIPGDMVKTTVFTILIERDANLDAKDIRELTALHISAGYGNVNAIRVLKELGANVNTPDSIGHTPLYIATKQGHADAIRVLKELGANVNTPDSIGHTPLYIATKQGHADAIRVLKELGAEETGGCTIS